MNSAATYLIKLHRLLNEYFSLEEIRTLCFNLHIDYESVPGEEKQSRIRELLLGLGRRSRLSELISLLQQERPLVDWPPVPDHFRLPESLAEETAVPPNQYHVYGDMVQGDKVSGDKIIIGDVSDGSVVAAGAGAVAVGSRGVYVTGDVHGSIHTGDVINYYITGAQIYFPQFTAAIENFFTYYLGTEKEPVPFGGRDQELAQLDNWLDQESTQRLLLVAPAGRGKSALLARWSQQLTTVQNLAVVFMPISVRFNTNREDNAFVILATRLAHFYGKQIPTNYASLSPQMWRGLVAEYLQEPLPDGRQLLLILDGLDEADWDVAADLLPLNLPSTTRIVASARYLGGEERTPVPWMHRLGWDRLPSLVKTIELNGLTRDGVQDLLEKMNFRTVEIVDQLYELSQGDPLLVELYVKDLQPKGETTPRLKPEDLKKIIPGYKGYFGGWWRDQKKLWNDQQPWREPLVKALLSILSLALGQITIDEIQELLLEGESFSSMDIQETVSTSLSRFILNDGKDTGFVFSHPKLADYFRERLTRRERQSWQSHFLDWGKQVLTDLNTEYLHPNDTPRYLLRYYIRHLRVSDNQTLIWETLTSLPWVTAQMYYDPTFKQLSYDVEMAIAHCETKGGESLPQMVAYSLFRGNIGSRVSRIPPETIGTIASMGNYERALDYAGLGDSTWYQTAAYISICEHLISQGNLSRSIDLLSLAQTIAEKNNHITLLCQISELLIQAGESSKAREVLLQAIKLLEDDKEDGEALVRAALTAVQLDIPEAISQIVDFVMEYEGPGFVTRNKLKGRLALVLGKAKKRDELIRLQTGEHRFGIGTEAYAWIAYGLYLAGDEESSERLFKRVKDDFGRNQKGERIYRRIESPDDIETALLAREIQTDGDINALDVLIKAQKVFIHDEEYACRDEYIFEEVVRNLIDNNRLDMLFVLGEVPTLFNYHVELFCRYAIACNKLGDVNNSLAAQTRAIEALDKFVEKYPPDWTYIRKAFQEVINMLLQSSSYSSLEKLLPITEKIDGVYGQAQVITVLVDAFHSCGNREKAETLITTIVQPRLRTPAHQTEIKAWASLAEAVATAENDEDATKELSQKATKASQAIGNCNYFIEEMGVIAKCLANIRDVEGLANLLSVTQQHPRGDFSRGSIIARIAQGMAEIEDNDGLQNAVIAASKTGYDEASFETLIEIAYILYDKGNIQGLLNIVAEAKNIEGSRFDPNYLNVMTTVSLLLVRMGEYEKANDVLSSLPWNEVLSPAWSFNRERYKLAIHNFALALAYVGQIDEVLNLVEFMDDKDFLLGEYGFNIDIDEIPQSDTRYVTTKRQTFSKDLTLIAAMIVWVGQHREKEEAVLKTLEVISVIHNPKNRFLGFMALANSLRKGEERLVSKVISHAMREIEVFKNKGEAEIICANTLIQAGQLTMALPMLEKYKNNVVRDKNNLTASEESNMEMLRCRDEGQVIKNVRIDLNTWLMVLESLILANEIEHFDNLFFETVVSQKASLYGSSNAPYVRKLYDFARLIFEVNSKDAHRVEKLLTLSLEATSEIEESFIKAFLYNLQSILYFQINATEQHEKATRLALDAFRAGYLESQYHRWQREIVKMIVLMIAENITTYPKNYVTQMIFAGLQFARKRGRSEVLEHIAIFAPILGRWEMAAKTWDRIKAIELLVSN